MSSPSESITDIDDANLNKKRGRAQSVEPVQSQDLEDQTSASQEASDATVSVSKKTKREDDENHTTSVNTIRRNMKDMTTTDKDSQNTSEDDEHMSKAASETFAKFGGGKGDDDDWGEFAEEEEESVEKSKETKPEEEKPKYTFGASSGFGTKGWASAHQSIPSTTTKPTFGGFTSSSGFGAFKSTTTTTSMTSTATTTATTTTTTTINTTTTAAAAAPMTSVPSFSAFAKATASPFAAVAASSTNALSNETSENDDDSATNGTENDNTSASFGEGAKLKVPHIKQQLEVKTGEEDEDTVFQSKAKLLVLDTTTGNWKERGVGTFRINMKEEESKDTIQTRLVMRTDSVYRLILNLLLFEGMKVFIMQEKFVRFAGFETETKEDGTVETKLINFALKFSNPSIAREVCAQITSCIPSSES